MTLHSPLSDLDWITPQRLRAMSRAGLVTVHDVLTHFPKRYEDRMRFDRFPDEESSAAVCVCGEVVRTAMKRFGGWRRMFEAVLEEPDPHALSRSIVCRWFNSPWVQKMIATGQRVVVYGRPKRRGKIICIDHPEFETVDGDEDVSIHFNRITPIYRATEGLSARVLRSTIFRLLQETDLNLLPESIPPELGNGLSYGLALRQIHFPETSEARNAARRYLVLGEFFVMQLLVGAKRAASRARRRPTRCGSGELARRFLDALGFPLTGAQRRAIEEIRADLMGGHPMNRLLHGDVGSGKTVVALASMLMAVESGSQAALMAPTQILAEQHYLTCRRWLAPLGVRLALRTGSRKEDTCLPLFDQAGAGASGPHAGSNDLRKPRARRQAVAPDEPQILVGTHALLYGGTGFSSLGLAVVDEQHKFGVMQRARLTAQGSAPDLLVMTATPIPRTLAMTAYGDLDVSTLDEMPAHRGKVITAVRGESKLPEIIRFIRDQLEGGRQAYIVYPLIDESDTLDVKAAACEFDKWSRLLDPARCELLHGRVDPAAKEAIMERFRRNETRVLVATSVIEVGIDVPNANLMLIENAERFGLAQLHQLRGRIGRGKFKSYCVLIRSTEAAEAVQKLRVLEQTSDGFAIAEADLRLRGAGDLLGTAQSGLPPLKLGDLATDADLMHQARAAATNLFNADPGLKRPENRHFGSLIAENRKRTFATVS